MKRSVLAFGFHLPSIEGFDVVSFTSDKSMLDADVIAAELNLDDFHASGEYAGTPRFSEDSSYRYRSAIQRWRQQLNTALELGKTVVMFLTARQEGHYYTGERRNDGTPGRPRVVSLVASCSNYDFLPFKLHKAQFASGTAMVLDSGADVLSAYWKSFGPYSVYQCFFEAEAAKSFILTRSGRNTVGCLSKQQKGHLILLPEIQWGHLGEAEDEESENGWSASYNDFTRTLRDALLEIDSRVRKETVRTAVPVWAEAKEYRLEIEPQIESEIVDLEARIEELSSERDRLAAELQQHGSLRRLLFEGGHELEAAVRDALVLLGFGAENFKEDGSEFDALFVGPEGRFLGEVEGKESKPVNVDKLSQLHRNIAEDLARDDVEEPAIPVLFGNAHRLLPVAERGEFFTDKVLMAAPAMNIALVRTPDLFAVARYVKDRGDMDFASACRRAIRDGRGKVVEFPEVPAGPPVEDAKENIG